MFATRTDLIEGAYAQAKREQFPVVFECNNDSVVCPFFLTLAEMRGWSKAGDGKRVHRFMANGGRVRALHPAAA
jgi:hypothetical protein